MAKKEGKPKKRRKPLPDPKKWKKCKHRGCGEFAIFLEDYCWRHLSEKANSNYKAKIVEWVRQRRSLEGANLTGVNLQEGNLWEANLQKAALNNANLENASLFGVNLQGADLYGINLERVRLGGSNLEEANLNDANLQEADLWHANLQGANLTFAILVDAELCFTNLQEADFEVANLQGASLLDADLRNANFKCAVLEGVGMQGVELDNTEGLTWGQIVKVAEESDRDWAGAEDAYRRLKNYFHQQGQYEDESKAYYREKLMAKHEAHEQCFKQKQPNSFFRWFGLWLLWAVAGFGERWMRIIPWVAGILAFFTGLFFLGSNLGWGAPYDHPTLLSIGNLFDCFVFSVVTFVTLGFGKIWTSALLAKLLIILEAALGFVFLGMFVVLIARKFGR